MKEQLGYLIDNYLAEHYLLKVVAAKVSVPEEEMKIAMKVIKRIFSFPCFLFRFGCGAQR